MNGQLSIDRRERRGVRILAPAGRIDFAHSDEFRDALVAAVRDAGADGLVVDLAEVEFLTSAGLRALAFSQRQAEDVGCTIVIARPARIVQEVFDISRFDLMFAIHDSLDAAVDACRARATG